jgi:hypothetical protein
MPSDKDTEGFPDLGHARSNQCQLCYGPEGTLGGMAHEQEHRKREDQHRKRQDGLASGVDGVIGLHFTSPRQLVSPSCE